MHAERNRKLFLFLDETSFEAGIKVQIHTQNEPPFIDQLGFGVAPGFQTFVSCQEQRVSPTDMMARTSYDKHRPSPGSSRLFMLRLRSNVFGGESTRDRNDLEQLRQVVHAHYSCGLLDTVWAIWEIFSVLRYIFGIKFHVVVRFNVIRLGRLPDSILLFLFCFVRTLMLPSKAARARPKTLLFVPRTKTHPRVSMRISLSPPTGQRQALHHLALPFSRTSFRCRFGKRFVNVVPDR